MCMMTVEVRPDRIIIMLYFKQCPSRNVSNMKSETLNDEIRTPKLSLALPRSCSNLEVAI
jgi:hypothetical protein